MGQTPEDIKKEYLEAFPGNTGELANHFFKEISFLHDKWNEFKNIYGKDPKIIDMLNEVAPYFFWLHQHLLFNDIILTIARLLDPAHSGRNKDDRNASFSRLIEDLKPFLSDKDKIKEWNKDLVILKEESSDVLKIRHKLLSHSDYNYNISRSRAELPRISQNKFEIIFEHIRSLSNKIEYYFMHKRTGYQFIQNSNTGCISLIAFIESHIEED